MFLTKETLIYCHVYVFGIQLPGAIYLDTY